MNILPINLVSFQKVYNNSFKCKNNYNLKYDSVSFSGKNARNEDSENIIAGTSLGKKILKFSRANNLSYENLSEMVNSVSPVKVEIKNLEECPVKGINTAGAVIAHMLPLYGLDFRLKMAKIHLGNIPNTSKEKTDLIANLAHEYTHVLQRANDENYYGILKYTQNPQEIAFIARAAKKAMDEVVRSCQMCLFSNQVKVNNVLNSVMRGNFNIEKSIDNSQFESIIENVAEVVSMNLGKNYNDMKDAIKGWVKQETQNEAEAYSVSVNVLDCSKNDPVIRAKRLLSKELYSFISNSL